MHFVLWDDLASQNMSHQQVVVHRLRNDLGDGRRLELDESIVLRLACLYTISVHRTKDVVSEQTYPLVPREAKPRYLTKLGKICAHLILVETVGNAAEKDHARF